MKTSIQYLIRILIIAILTSLASCNEDKFLAETPPSFYSPENSYVTESDFESTATQLYARVRFNLYGSSGSSGSYPYWTSTDIAQDGRGQLTSPARFGGHSTYLVPTNGTVKSHWDMWYKLISDANTVIDRISVTTLPDEVKNRYCAEAKFMRAFGYRFLVYLFGDVPLSLHEVLEPKIDYSRAKKEDVLHQMVEDLLDAVQGLPEISATPDGRISKLVADHLLAETYISLGEYQKAIDAATTVINDPNVELMRNRFGSMAEKKPFDPYLKFTEDGDVYWDLFRVNNQNRSSGNKESLWVIQWEVDTEGGGLTSSGNWMIPGTKQVANVLERIAGPVAWMTFKDPDGKEGALTVPQSNYNSGGCGVSLMRNTEWFLNDLWKSDWDNDIRNAPHNIVRDFVYNNPKSAYFGKSSTEYPSPTQQAQSWRWYPYPSKITTPGQHPEALYLDKDVQTLRSQGGSTYRDNYVFRLAETYLLRAEAYLDAGEKNKAAEDINAVRSRSMAKPVAASDVTLDYILDERARELVYEEPRRITLHRTGKLVERVRKYNLLNKDEIQDYHGLWPIPQSFIEANIGAKIEQNPGY